MGCARIILGTSRVSSIWTFTITFSPEGQSELEPAPAGPLEVRQLPYRPDTVGWFSHLVAIPWAVLLDSAGDPRGRFDIVAVGPRLTLETRGAVTQIRGESGLQLSLADPFELLRRCLGPATERPIGLAGGLPFVGGAIGWLGYDLARRIERLPATAKDPLGLPEMAVGIYDWSICVDHGARRSWLIGRAGESGWSRRVLTEAHGSTAAPSPGPFRTRGRVETSLSPEDYRNRFVRLQAYILAGDCYQANLARRFSALAEGDPWSAYQDLRGRSPAPHSAFLRTPEATVLSVSPERFLKVRDGEVESTPIKGTAPRGATPEADRILAQALLSSPKDRAENLMIVDLLRNDLGRTCAIGSVRVPRLFELATFASVHHLTSTVTGRLAPGRDLVDLVRGAFPGGSITGAPKIRAMEILEELEGERRGVYCGSIGYLGADGSMDLSIAIRTAVYARGRLSFWAGGGIVADSDVEREAEEIAVKARPMLELVDRFRDG
jgi:para-aminobenzoate synthetase component 1